MSMMRTFRQMLGTLSRGDFDEKLNEQVREAVECLENMPADKGKAELTIKIVFNYELGRIDIDPSSKLKLPDDAKYMKTPFWIHDGELSTDHPNQINLFREVSSTKDDGDVAHA